MFSFFHSLRAFFSRQGPCPATASSTSPRARCRSPRGWRCWSSRGTPWPPCTRTPSPSCPSCASCKWRGDFKLLLGKIWNSLMFGSYLVTTWLWQDPVRRPRPHGVPLSERHHGPGDPAAGPRLAQGGAALAVHHLPQAQEPVSITSTDFAASILFLFIFHFKKKFFFNCLSTISACYLFSLHAFIAQ